MSTPESILEALEKSLGFNAGLAGGRGPILRDIERVMKSANVDNVFIGSPLWDELIAITTVPETSFFRHPESFKTLGAWAAQQQNPSLRALCLPCSTGEEAWSIAITLHDAGLRNFRVEAGDISAAAVKRATVANYSARDLRKCPPAVLPKYFIHDAQGWHIAEELRATVDFRTMNILSETFFGDLPAVFDIIFCRNLLIYCEPPVQKQIFDRLDRWLRPGGLLFLGPGEATAAGNFGWKSANFPMAFAFLRESEAEKKTAPIRIDPIRRFVRALPRPIKKPEPTREIAAPAPTRESKPSFLRAQELAGAGKLTEATMLLDRLEAQHREPLPDIFLLRGVIAESVHDTPAAEQFFRKALYLAPENIEVLLHLSLLLEATGRNQAAAPFRRRLERARKSEEKETR